MFLSTKKMTSCLVHNIEVIINAKQFVASAILAVAFTELLSHAAHAQENHEPRHNWFSFDL